MLRAMHPAATRHVVTAALVLLVLGAAGAVKAGIAGADFMYDLEDSPALARAAPVVRDAGTPRLARRVYLVVIDGLRLDKSYELPFLDELRRRGIDTEAQTHYPSWSRPNYVSILTGVPPSASGVRTNFHSQPVQLDSLMDRARAARLKVAAATDYDVLPKLFLRRLGIPARISLDLVGIDATGGDVDVDSLEDPTARSAVRSPDAELLSPFDDARYAPWPGGFTEAGSALVAGGAELVVLLVGAVDAAGHEFGGASPAYRAAAENVDNALARVFAQLDTAQDTVVVVADHGHTNRGGHGGLEPEVMTVPLIAAGPGIRRGAAAHDARLIDIAPTVAALLGIPAPGHGLGRTLLELLDLPAEASTRRIAADQMRLAITHAVVERAERIADADVLEDRAERIVIVALCAILAVGLALLLVRRRVMHLDVRILLVTVPSFFLVYVGLIGLLGQRFSPSFLPARGHLAATLVRYGSAAVVAQLLASMWALRARHNFGERLAAANGTAWTGLVLTMVPAGLVWAFFPAPFDLVPSPFWLVAIPAIEVAVASAAANVALTLFVEVAVFVSRAWAAGSVRASG